MKYSRQTNDVFQRKIYRLALLAVFAGGVWAYNRYVKPTPDAAPPAEREQAKVVKEIPAAHAPPETTDRAPKTPANVQPSKSHHPAPAHDVTHQPASALDASHNPLVLRSLTLHGENGEVVYRGDIDLKPTLDRIAADRRLHFSHDGITFQNREARLPRQPSGYYHEWVVPTPGEHGPGPQRVITGRDGDVWYTADHYRSFRRIPYQTP